MFVFACLSVHSLQQRNKEWDQEHCESFRDLSTHCSTHNRYQTPFVQVQNQFFPLHSHLCIFLCTEIQSDEAGWSNTMDIKGIYMGNLFPVFFPKSKCNFELICNLLFQNSLQIKRNEIASSVSATPLQQISRGVGVYYFVKFQVFPHILLLAELSLNLNIRGWLV